MLHLLYAVLHDEMDETFEDYLPYGINHYEVMFFYVPVLIEQNGTWTKYPAQTCILYAPNQYVHYKAASGKLLYDWIRFDCDEPFFTDTFIPFGQPFTCYNHQDFYSYWQLIAHENIAGYRTRDYVLNQLMLILLYRLHDYALQYSPTPYQDSLITLRDDIYLHPEYDWCLTNMASQLNISTRLLQKTYKSLFKISCREDVITSRISHAKNLLTHTEFSIQKISDTCGYRTLEHFCRQFKTRTGIPPTLYRQNTKNLRTNN